MGKSRKLLTIINPNTALIGKKFVFIDECSSTNVVAHEFLNCKNDCEGLVIQTNYQNSGKGQRGQLWISAPKMNLTFSAIIMTEWLEINKLFNLTKCVSLSLVKFLNDETQLHFQIKWPNDIYFNNNKIGGILIENNITGQKINSTIIGIGLNINQTDFGKLNATSLKKITEKNFNLSALLEKYCAYLENHLLKLKSNSHFFDKEYLDNLLGFEETRAFIIGGKQKIGKIKDVNNNGNLLVEIKDKVHNFNIKEIEFVFS